jgi:L-rhamnose mutarotase
MSLTKEAYDKRMWGPYPSLRKVLSNKQISNYEYTGITSAHDNIFDATNRLIEIAILADENEREIKKIAKTEGRKKVWEELERLEESLKYASYRLENFSDRIREVRREL